MSKRTYGWKHSLPELSHEEHTFGLVSLPSLIDLRTQCPSVYDQGQLGSCTANMSAAILQFVRRKEGDQVDFIPSRLFQYYNERMIEGTVSEDSGATIADAFKAMAQYGICPETEWPYTISHFKTKPTAKCFLDAVKFEAINPKKIAQDLTQLKTCLASGYLVGIGISVYASFESAAVAASGIVPLPAKSEKFLGGHAVTLVGYDDTKQVFIVRNSWGTGWGMAGYFTLPYAYVTNPKLASDFWTVMSTKG